MMAIYLALSHFLSRLRGQTILIRTDNSTYASYLKRQGGTKVPQLTYLTWKLFHLCMDHNVQLVAVHLAGKLKSLADQLSRATRPVATEWALNSHVFRAITQKWGGARNRLVHYQAQQAAARLCQALSGPSGV